MYVLTAWKGKMMAIVIGSKSGVIGDTSKGFDLQAYLEKQLAIQCLEQHKMQDASFNDVIKAYYFNDDKFIVEYLGSVWEYSGIDLGHQEMCKNQIK